jgi:glycosyltransferase involved in cell wall biosynthesis
LIAVVIPVFNQADYIGEALDSVAAQTLQPSEIIVVDDGSTDGSGEIAEARGVAVVRTEQMGPGPARWAGVAQTMAPLIAFLDADDRLTPCHHRLLSDALDASGADAACGMACEFAEPGTGAAERYVINTEPRIAAFAGTALLRRARYLEAAVGTTDRLNHDWFGIFDQLADRVTVPELVLERRIHGQNRSIVNRDALRAEYLRSARAAIMRARGDTT